MHSPDFESIVREATPSGFSLARATPISGGCINDAYRIESERDSYFIKLNDSGFLSDFENERDALQEILDTDTIRVPKPIATGCSGSKAYLLLEFIEPGRPSKHGWEAMGARLAALHKTPMPAFGWKQSNAIGTTPQPNALCDDWIAFFRERRLGHQLELCRSKGFQFENAETLLSTLPAFFEGHSPTPSLLHGDLWSGNAGFDRDGNPFIFDPATYCGDRETDIAFTEFFGGFDPAFYASYNQAAPLDAGYASRKTLYNLYHCLNHLYLFGGGYAHQAQSMIDQLNGNAARAPLPNQ